MCCVCGCRDGSDWQCKTRQWQESCKPRCTGRGNAGIASPLRHHQRAEKVACMLQPTPATLKETADEVSRKGSRLDGLYRRPCTRTISRVRRRFRLTGMSDAKVGRGGPGISLSAPQIESLRKWCRAPDGQKRGTRRRFARDWFERKYNTYVHISTVCRWLQILAQTRKKGTRVAKQQDPNQLLSGIAVKI